MKNKETKKVKINLKKLGQEILNLATSEEADEQLGKVEVKTLYNAVYCVNKILLNRKKQAGIK